MSRVGLVTTFRFVPLAPDEEGQAAIINGVERCWSTLSSFLLFHLAKGVEHIFLYADADDGSNQVYIDRVTSYFNSSQVSVDVRDEVQKKRQQESCQLWNELEAFSATEVPARQSLNAEDAMLKAGEMGLNWLLHLDVDELFYTSEASIQPHFDRLNNLGVEQMTYANHEAVPSSEDISDYFREVNLFRVNPLLLPLSRSVGESTLFWRRRTSHGQYMLAYDNGKAAVRVMPGRIIPQSVHRWRTLRAGEKNDCAAHDEGPDRTADISSADGQEPGLGLIEGIADSVEVLDGGKNGDPGRSGTESGQKSTPGDQLVNRVAMVDPRELHFDEVLECNDPYVLHYPSCGLDWLRDKYRLLGNFPSSWFGGKLPIAPCFHLDARNAFHEGIAFVEQGAGADVEGDRSRELYRNEVMLCPEKYAEEIKTQLENGVLRVINGPANLIKRARNMRGALGSLVTPMTVPTIREAHPRKEVKEEVLTEPEEDGSVETAAAVGRRAAAEPPVNTVLGAAKRGELPSARVDEGITEDLAASASFENSWILAACAREFL